MQAGKRVERVGRQHLAARRQGLPGALVQDDPGQGRLELSDR
jgi:hypothetical protein